MDILSSLVYYASVAALVIIPATGVGFGQSRVAQTVLHSMDEQPHAHKQLSTLFFIALAISETAAIFCVMLGLSLLFSPYTSAYQTLAALGIVCALAVPAVISGLMGAYPTQAALSALARQPHHQGSIIKTMILGQTVLQTPVIFGLIIALIIKSATHDITLLLGLKTIAAGLAVSVGMIGPTIGLSRFSQKACSLIGLHPESYNYLINFVLISQALIETPILFGFLTAIIIIVLPLKSTVALAAVPSFMAALACGITTFGPGISSGKTAAEAAHALAHAPEHRTTISRTSMLAQTLIDTSAILGLVVAILILFTQ